MERRILDYTLVPVGLLIMVAYHAWLLLRIVNHPTKTVVGVNAISRRFWVAAMMEDVPKNGVLAVQTLRNNIMASTLLASTAIMLSSLIAMLMTNSGGGGLGDHMSAARSFVYGDRSDLGFSIKFFSILVCFLAAFLLNVQSIRYYSHASILINVPFKKMSPHHHHHLLTSEYVAKSVNRGSYFWSLGLRAFYFSLPLFFWIFGPIPMFLCCVLLAFMFYFLDVTFDLSWAVGVDHNSSNSSRHGEDDHTLTYSQHPHQQQQGQENQNQIQRGGRRTLQKSKAEIKTCPRKNNSSGRPSGEYLPKFPSKSSE